MEDRVLFPISTKSELGETAVPIGTLLSCRGSLSSRCQRRQWENVIVRVEGDAEPLQPPETITICRTPNQGTVLGERGKLGFLRFDLGQFFTVSLEE